MTKPILDAEAIVAAAATATAETSKQKALAAIESLVIGDCLQFFYDRATPRDHQIADLVETDDELEVDGAIVSEGDSGAFVLAWTYVELTDELMKEDEE